MTDHDKPFCGPSGSELRLTHRQTPDGPSDDEASGQPTSLSSMKARSARRGSTNLIALSSAAVLAVYAAGYVRTRSAADQMAAAGNERRPAAPRIDTFPQLAVAARDAVIGGDTAIGGSPGQPSSADGLKQWPKAKPVLPKTAASASPSVKPIASAEPDTAVANAAATTVEAGVPPSQPTTNLPATHASTVALPASSAPVPVAAAPVVAASPPASTAPVSTEASPPPAAAVKPVWRDGMFVGRGTSRHGDIEAMVEIKDGRIIGAVISQCLTRYSCSWINHLLPQVVARQSPDVDYVSGATQSANALYYAVLQALAQAK